MLAVRTVLSVAALVGLLSLGCASKPAAVLPQSAPTGATLNIFVYSEEPRYPLAKASVVLVSDGGSEVLGLTDIGGAFKIDRSRLNAPGARALLFCFDQSPRACSAIRLDTGDPLGLTELSVNVPLPRAVDRFVVQGK